MVCSLHRFFAAPAMTAGVSGLLLARPAVPVNSELSHKAEAFGLQGFIDRESKAGNQRIVVPPGRYQITP